jgi:hypothetical protein
VPPLAVFRTAGGGGRVPRTGEAGRMIRAALLLAATLALLMLATLLRTTTP